MLIPLAIVALGLMAFTAFGVLKIARVLFLAPVPATGDTSIAPFVEVTGEVSYGSLRVSISGWMNRHAICMDHHLTNLKIVGYPGGTAIELPHRMPHAMDAQNTITLSGAMPPPEATTIDVSGDLECRAPFTTYRPRTSFHETLVLRDAAAP